MKKYTAVYGLNVLGTYDSIEQAFVPIYDKIQEVLKNDNMNWYVLEETVWVEYKSDEGYVICMPFNELRDYMIKNKFMVDGYLDKELINR